MTAPGVSKWSSAEDLDDVVPTRSNPLWHRRSPRVLFLRPDHIGDVLLTLPAVAALRKAFPGAYVAYATPADSATVAEHCPHVDEPIAVAFPPMGRPEAEADRSAWCDVLRAESPRLAGAFDAALVVRPDDPWSGELVAAASIPIRLGFGMPRTRPHLTDAIPPPQNRHVALDGFELVDALLARLGVRSRPARVLDACFVPTAQDERDATATLTAASADEAPVILHPGSGWPLKNWPPMRWRELASALASELATRPLVAGTAGERTIIEHVAAGTGAIPLAGQLSLGALAALHRRARLVVTTDSGALHLAAFMRAPAVALFGPGDPVLFAPLAPRHRMRIVRAGLACSPCGTLEHPPCGASVEPACVTAISVEHVLAATVDLVS